MEKSNIFDNMPSDRGIFISENEQLIVKVNNLDHLEIIYRDAHTNVSKFFKDFYSIIKKLDEVLSFSHDKSYGFVTTLPQHLGSTLKT